jgi:hypothetical protein
MTILDLTKATLVCGASCVLVYSYPLLSQIIVIAVLTLMWTLYAYRTIGPLLRRKT